MFDKISLWLAILSLSICLAAPVMHFLGWMELTACKTVLAVATAGWFILATARTTRRSGKKRT